MYFLLQLPVGIGSGGDIGGFGPMFDFETRTSCGGWWDGFEVVKFRGAWLVITSVDVSGGGGVGCER